MILSEEYNCVFCNDKCADQSGFERSEMRKVSIQELKTIWYGYYGWIECAFCERDLYDLTQERAYN